MPDDDEFEYHDGRGAKGGRAFTSAGWIRQHDAPDSPGCGVYAVMGVWDDDPDSGEHVIVHALVPDAHVHPAG